MDKTWLASYPEGVAPTLATDAQRTLVDVLDDACRAFSDQPAFINMGVALTYAELDARSRDLAAYFQHALGLARGERVAIMMPNLLQYPVTLFAVLRAGLVAVNVNPLYTARELAHQLADAGARAIVVVENFAATVDAAMADTELEAVIVTRAADFMPWPKRVATQLVIKWVKRMVPAYALRPTATFRQALAAGSQQPFAPVAITSADLAFLQYTGGTTGLAKGARLSHRNMVANLDQCAAWLAPITRRGQERIVTALPLYHVFALTANCLVFLEQGGSNRLVTNPRDLASVVAAFGEHRPTAFTGVNTLFNALIHDADFAKLDFSDLKLTLGGGAAVQKPVADAWQSLTGCVLTEAYGLTETAPAVCINRFDAGRATGCIGLPLPATEVSIRNDAGRAVTAGEPGELCVRGPQVMDGYWRQPEESRAAFFDDGFLRTGDIAAMDENGYCRIVDRKKDMILVSGFNVFPNEIEAVIAKHPKVLEAGAVGVADDKSGEVIKVFVVKRDASLSETEVLSFCRERLTGYKVPKHVAFIDELPKSNVGKILRKSLRER